MTNGKIKHIILSADGEKPKATIGAILTDKGCQFIVEGNPMNVLKMFIALYGTCRKHSQIPSELFDEMMKNSEAIDDFEERMKNESQD